LVEIEATSDDDQISVLDDYNSDSSYTSNPKTEAETTMSLVVTRKPAPPRLSLEQHANSSPNLALSGSPPSANTLSPSSINIDKPLPKSPGSSKLGSFFTWGSPTPSTGEFSDKGFSPLPSPYVNSKHASTITTLGPSLSRTASTARNGSDNSREYCESYLATPPPDPSSSAALQIEDMEDELKAISAELAASIRREMDLEDLVDRLQSERDNPTSTSNKRTSDYFSDSGYSSAKSTDYEQSKEEIEKIQRRSEQEKAQLRLELSSKLQDERSKRQELDEQIRELSHKASRVDLAQVKNVDATGRVRELESTCDTLRRKLSEERKVKDNFEDLISALRGELEDTSNERDNLRDEIVPQLRARVEGLETQASDLERMTYESTKIQQELQSLKVENTTLKKKSSMGSISEEPTNLTRSNSITGPPSGFTLQRPPSLSRSKTVKTTESREALSDRLKDVEEQRDALHKALKALLDRQECQNRENNKKIRVLEVERDRLLTSSPEKAGFSREISHLREEINVLRRRSEEALEQKWQVEKGLAGLKMDLDRAEQEISSLRSVLAEKDILIPEFSSRASGNSDRQAVPTTSESLTKAYQDLQQAYSGALSRIKQLELGTSPEDEKTKLAVVKLERALSAAVSERDIARQDASSYNTQLDSLRAGEQAHLKNEKQLADELGESARRVEELATQVRQQLASNHDLRQRLTDTVSRGEAAQKANAERIVSMEARLRDLEEQLMAAQSASEERVARHEEEIANLKDSHNKQLSRLSGHLRSPRTFPANSPMSPLFSNSAKSPRLSTTRAGPAMSVADETQVDALRAKVRELERALAEAETAMEEVVGRMNTAQIEVMQLQEEREVAIGQTRRLEKQLQDEQVKTFQGRFKTLQA
jgi:chromosome segregation ATPase